MRSLVQPLRISTAVLLVGVFSIPSTLLAQGHVVTPSEIQKEVVTSSQSREQKLEAVQQFLSSERARKALESSRMDAEQVKTAVATLSEAELTELAAYADKAQSDFAAGDLSERDLLLIILGIAALILIIVAVR
jgi:hypothetical protein